MNSHGYHFSLTLSLFLDCDFDGPPNLKFFIRIGERISGVFPALPNLNSL